MYVNETIRKHSTNNTKHSKYKYTYYQNTHTLPEYFIFVHQFGCLCNIPFVKTPSCKWPQKVTEICSRFTVILV